MEALLKLPYLLYCLIYPAPHTAALHLPAAGRGISTSRLVSDLSQLNNVLDIPSNTHSGKPQPAQTFSLPGQDQVPHYTPESGLQTEVARGAGVLHSQKGADWPAPTILGAPTSFVEGSFQSKPVRRGWTRKEAAHRTLTGSGTPQKPAL